jgi:rhodanese-related sulfurtransferase
MRLNASANARKAPARSRTVNAESGGNSRYNKIHIPTRSKTTDDNSNYYLNINSSLSASQRHLTRKDALPSLRNMRKTSRGSPFDSSLNENAFAAVPDSSEQEPQPPQQSATLHQSFPVSAPCRSMRRSRTADERMGGSSSKYVESAVNSLSSIVRKRSIRRNKIVDERLDHSSHHSTSTRGGMRKLRTSSTNSFHNSNSNSISNHNGDDAIEKDNNNQRRGNI